MLKNELMYGYVDDMDKDFMSYEMALDLSMEKAALAFEYADRKYDLDINAADLKVLNESGTYEDIDMLYEAAAADNKEKKQGVIASICNAIINFITNIFNKIKGFFTKENDEKIKDAVNSGKLKNVKASGDAEKHVGKLEEAFNSLAAFLKPGFHETAADGNKVLSIRKTLVTSLEAVGLGTIGVLSAKKALSAKDRYIGLMDKAKGIVENFKNTLGSAFKKAPKEVQDAGKEVEGAAAEGTEAVKKSALEGISQIIKEAGHGLGDLMKGFGEGLKNAPGKVINKLKSKKNSDADGEDEEFKEEDGEEAATEESADDDIDDTDTSTLLEACNDIIELFD